MITLKEWVAIENRKWKEVERDLCELLASYGEPPVFTNQINRWRRGEGKPNCMQYRALMEMTDNMVESFRDQ
jgi:hypothetical protein